MIIPGIGWSDHWAFGQYGFQGVMVTDTAPFRYPHYHEPTDTPDKIDTERLARVVKGMERVLRELGDAELTAWPARRRSSAAARRSWSERSAANPSSARTARNAKACASSASADQPA